LVVVGEGSRVAAGVVVAGGSQVVVEGSLVVVEDSLVVVEDSLVVVEGSRAVVEDNWVVVEGIWAVVEGSWAAVGDNQVMAHVPVAGEHSRMWAVGGVAAGLGHLALQQRVVVQAVVGNSVVDLCCRALV